MFLRGGLVAASTMFLGLALVLADAETVAMTLTLTSSAFKAQGKIPAKYTCEGDDVSPPLSFAGVPSGTKSLTLIIDDPDAPDPAAPQRVWVHWVVYNIRPMRLALPKMQSRRDY
jgi:phosphatidylethanolamine-binding protein (PEBP) family uncharacterized protein